MLGKLLSSYIFPHPPIIVPEVGRGDEIYAKNTIDSCIRASKEIKALNPDTIIIITPHGPIFKDALAISTTDKLSGSFKNFRAPYVTASLNNDTELVKSIIEKCDKENISIVEVNEKLTKKYNIDLALDHGSLVPLYFVNKELSNFKLVHITIGLLDFEELFRFGELLNNTISESGKNVVIIASGDLSHKLTQDAPAGYNPRAKDFDEKLVRMLDDNKVREILLLENSRETEEAGECGLRSIVIMLGSLAEHKYESEVFSYEGPYGVGYCIAGFRVKEVKT